MHFWSWHTWLVHRSGRDGQKEEEVWSGLAGTAKMGVGGRGVTCNLSGFGRVGDPILCMDGAWR